MYYYNTISLRKRREEEERDPPKSPEHTVGRNPQPYTRVRSMTHTQVNRNESLHWEQKYYMRVPVCQSVSRVLPAILLFYVIQHVFPLTTNLTALCACVF